MNNRRGSSTSWSPSPLVASHTRLTSDTQWRVEETSYTKCSPPVSCNSTCFGHFLELFFGTLFFYGTPFQALFLGHSFLRHSLRYLIDDQMIVEVTSQTKYELKLDIRIVRAQNTQFLEMEISRFVTQVKEYMESSTLHGMRY